MTSTHHVTESELGRTAGVLAMINLQAPVMRVRTKDEILSDV